MKLKRAVMIGLALSLAVGLSGFFPSWFAGSLEDALARARSTGKLLLLDFFQEYG